VVKLFLDLELAAFEIMKPGFVGCGPLLLLLNLLIKTLMAAREFGDTSL
tara:strand:+ start:260 stop:406 length:147 start_codon:yes stop_codon:yes gene_type:complete